MKRILIGLMTASFATAAMATTVGISNHPFTMKKHVLTTEYNNYFNGGTGMGLGVNYSQRIDQSMNIDAGFAFTDGERASRFHLGANMQIIPDYGRQPKVSVKALLGTENYEGNRINSFGAAPTLSKGFAVSGNELFPFVALPMKVSLNTDEKIYETSTAMAMGITGRLPLAGTNSLIGNFEINMPIRNSATSMVMGISLPIE